MKYTALAIDPEIDSRMRLKQATLTLPRFGNTLLFSSLQEASRQLDHFAAIDIVFISDRVEETESRAFVEQGKQSIGGQDSAYVLVIDSNKNDSTTIAAQVMAGFDGFLVEPFSLEDLDNTTVLATKVKKDRGKSREIKAMELIVSDMIAQLDKIAYLRTFQFEPSKSMKRLREQCSVLGMMNAEAQEIYFEIALRMFEEAPLNTYDKNLRHYQGVSSRIRKIMEEKIIAELEE